MIASPMGRNTSGTPNVLPAEAASARTQSTASSPIRRRGAVVRWLGASLLVVIAALTLIALNGTAPSAREPLHPESASPEGAKALVQVLGDHGVPVHLAQGREEGLRLLGALGSGGDGSDGDSGGGSTLVITAPAIPSDAAIANFRELVAAADQTVFLIADDKILADFKLGSVESVIADELVHEPGNSTCPANRFAGIGEIRAQVLFEPATGVQGCFDSSDGQSALLVAPSASSASSAPGASDEATITMIDATELFDNAHLAENGNAALAFALLGNTEEVVWYLASPEDIAADRAGTLAALTPKWVTPVMLLLLITAVVAAIWRGRRFGPLVEERLPVTVRASETMFGRARLAAHNGHSAHAAEALREGATRRLARRLGMPTTSTPEQIARAVPSEPALMPLLVGPLPPTDAELVSFARALGAILDRIDPQVITTNATDATDERSTP